MKGLIIFVALLSILIGYGYHKFDELTRPLPLPTFDTNKYWGPGDASKYKEDKSIKPFKIDIDPKVSNKFICFFYKLKLLWLFISIILPILIEIINKCL